MVARNEELPEGSFAERHRDRGRSIKIRGDTFLAIRGLSLRHSVTQTEYLRRTAELFLRIELQIGGDPLAYLEAYLEEKFPDSA